ncbi:unnamed protein product [Adineta steineri]|uniref:Uncharacterized protein n=1 Tax=Adineta steineri TaxID=433720 RepID=A0A813RKI7_9BILA|nr:unnamed protein product [Adineta steineri]
MDSCKCPITNEIFRDPVMGDDGHTYERKAITEWLKKNGTSPITREPMDINSLKTNYAIKKVIQELKSTFPSQQEHCQFQLDVDIRKTRTRPLFQGFGKSIYEVEWINRNGPPIILLRIDGAKANREASFYVQLSCHPHIVRTFGLVQSNPGSFMLLQECAPHGDLSELLRENGFKPIERVLRKIFLQVCDAMICLADNGIIHGDLACRNVLVFRFNPIEPNGNLVKLTDFGLTRGSTIYSMVDSPSMTTMTTIPIRYVAPEILRSPDKANYSEKSDVYSMGVLMWEACSYGELPYSSLSNDSDVRQRKLNDERLPQPSQCSHQLWRIINECFQQESSERPTFENLKDLLSTLHSESTNRVKRQQPVINEITCKYCQQLCSTNELDHHEENCDQHPHRKQGTIFHTRSLPKQRTDNIDPTSSIHIYLGSDSFISGITQQSTNPPPIQPSDLPSPYYSTRHSPNPPPQPSDPPTRHNSTRYSPNPPPQSSDLPTYYYSNRPSQNPPPQPSDPPTRHNSTRYSPNPPPQSSDPPTYYYSDRL